jgi:hypothetical protein
LISFYQVGEANEDSGSGKGKGKGVDDGIPWLDRWLENES